MVKKHEHHAKMGAKHHVVMTEAQYRRHVAKPKAGHKGAPSKTRRADMDYTSKRGDKDHHIGGHDVRKRPAPFRRSNY